MTRLFNEKPICEHAGYPNGLDVSQYNTGGWESIRFKGIKDKYCLELKMNWGGVKTIQSSYYVGADWLDKGKLAIYVEPKLNEGLRSTDYFKMLFEGFSNPDIAVHLPDIFEMKADQPSIILPHRLDLLTPLLIYQYLVVLKSIVKKGLKKNHETIQANLNNRIKGKIMVSQQIKQNLLKNRPLKNYCQFNNFSVNGPENRILKKALNFASRYLDHGYLREYKPLVEKLLHYIRPAFTEVSDITDLNDVRNIKVSAFYKEYREALHLADMIFKRYGYNINAIEPINHTVKVPPFWIDMSKLYELYVLAHLRKQSYKSDIKFQPQGKYGNPDYILCDKNHMMVIDAKYKPYYDERYVASDIRQLSGYARDKGILESLGVPPNEYHCRVIDCLIIYPLKEVSPNSSLELTALTDHPIKEFSSFFKKSFELPFQQTL